MTNHPNRNRVTIWPLDAWSRRSEFPEGDALYWTRKEIVGWRIPETFEHIAWIEQGYDRGPLLRNRHTGIYAMGLPFGAVRSVHARKVQEALSAWRQAHELRL